jgi:tRNA threonylcarbamoyladenosine biosynthesis protein TsaE
MGIQMTDSELLVRNLHSPDQTRNLGIKLGKLLTAGDTLLLSGDLGAGKTTLTQSIAKGLEVSDKYYVTSPSFALMQEYPGRYPLYHMDCYRLSGEDDIEAAGLSEYLVTRNGVCIVEWPDRLGSLMPREYLHIQITLLQENERQIVFAGHGADWSERLRLCLQPESDTDT